MKYSFDFYIICNDQTVLDAVKAGIPDTTDSKVWNVEYDKTQWFTEDANKVFSGMVRFNSQADRDTLLNAVKNQVKDSLILSKILKGSWIAEHLCDHDKPFAKRTGCTRNIIWSK